MADELKWLDAEHPIYTLHKAAWAREERRLYGGDAVLAEVARFEGESAASHTARQGTATYVNFPKMHASTVTGRLRQAAPKPDFGILGEIRERSKIDVETKAELLYYNVDGVGGDGSQYPAWYDGVDERAQATGHRWLMIERPAGNTTDGAGELEYRPYAVEFSPLDVTNWYYRHGQLQFAVVRVPDDAPRIENGVFAEPGALGYYLLVRKGYDGLGSAFAGGGWWKYDADKQPIAGGLAQGDWAATGGEIPMWVHYGEMSRGTADRPAMSRSSTMELGQIAVSLMNTISARDYDAWDAAASRLYFLNATPEVMAAVKQQHDARSIMIGVPPAPAMEGSSTIGERVVTVYDGSLGAVPAQVFATIVEAKFREAREQSIQQVTSTPDSSGRSKEAGDAESKAPYLARRAQLREQSENNFIRFAELRFGADKTVDAGAEPIGSVQWPDDFSLAPLVSAIDAQLARMRLAGVRSATLTAYLIERAGEEEGTLPPEDTSIAPDDERLIRDVIRAELRTEAASPDDDPLAGLLRGGAGPSVRPTRVEERPATGNGSGAGPADPVEPAEPVAA